MFKAIPTLSLLALLTVGGVLAVCGQEAARPKPANVKELLARLQSATASLQDYTVNATTTFGGRSLRLKIVYKRPNLVRIDTPIGQASVQPNGDIKGRLGHGPLGKRAFKIDRNEKRLRDAEGIPFYQIDFPSMLARVQEQIKEGAAATMTADANAYRLEIHSGDTTWEYAFAPNDFSLLENSRWVKGKQAQITRYSDFQPNTGIQTDYFRF